ncbi:hypothetical protein BKA67DRAFT_529061 [Truncatella angustata]|uniref:Uncharacterized protein n=1 Tax=Truncatella angustata TaxID=152316 RepID=A0A9P8UV30_9PEZI|nr:uncharacterized protein BKA67DRAFT_529061 [Truncatella angustata]KAH6658870.1 hypothetical protein BKA67DRAFT_529061 [Truncatella angustata]
MQRENEQIQRENQELLKHIEELRASQKCQEQMLERQNVLICAMETQQAKAECFLSEQNNYNSAAHSQHPRAPPESYPYDELMALVETYRDESRISNTLKRKAEDVTSGDVKRQALYEIQPTQE